MRSRRQRAMAWILAAAMTLTQTPTSILAGENTEAQAPVATEAPAPETQAPETQAPETQPQTSAPETQAPETAAPETQAETQPATQAQETQPQAPETQEQTQAQETQAPETSAPETQAETVPESQPQTEQTVEENQPVSETAASTEEQAQDEEEDEEEKETEKALESRTFDLTKSDVVIKDGKNGTFKVTYDGTTYKKVSAEGEFVFTGKASHKIVVDTDQNVTLRLVNLTLDSVAGETAFALTGNGQATIVIEGSNKLTSDGAALVLGANKDVTITAANDGAALDVNSRQATAVTAGKLNITAHVNANGADGYYDIAALNITSDERTTGDILNGSNIAATLPAETEVTEAATEEATEAATEEATEALSEVETEEVTEATKTLYEYEDDQVYVSATVVDPAAIPDDAELVVLPITDGAEYDAYIAAVDAATAVETEAANVEPSADGNDTIAPEVAETEAAVEEVTLVYDISFKAPKRDEEGNVIEGEFTEIEPENGSVSVQISFKNNQLTNELGVTAPAEVDVYHLPEKDGQILVENMNAAANVGEGTESVSFETSFFSPFMVKRAPAKAPTVGAPVTLDISLSPAGKIEAGDNYWVFVKASKTKTNEWDNQTDIYYWQQLTADGSSAPINITSWKDQNGNNANGAQLDPSQNITVEVYNSPTGKTPGTATFMSDMNNWSKVTEGGAVKNYSIHYGDKEETDNSITFPIELKAKEVSNDYDYLSILGPGVNYGISANYFNQTGHIQTNLAINNYSASAGNSQIEPNLTGAGGAVVIANSDAPEIRICSGMGDKGAMVALFYPESYSGKVTIDQAAQDSTVKVPSNGSKLKSDIVDPILRHGEQVSGELLSHEPTIIPSGQVIDTMAYPDDATIYIDGDAITDYEHLTINKKSGQMLIFNFDTTSSVSFKTYKVNVDGTGARSVTPNTAQGNTNTWLDNEVCRKIVFNCASCSSVSVNGSAGIFLLPRSDSSFTTNGTSTGWIISSGHVQAGGAEWHNGYGDMPDVTQAVLHFSKTVDGKLAKNYQKFVFKLERYNASNGNWETIEEAATNNGSLLEMVINNMGNGYNAYRVTEYAVADGTPGAYTLVTDPIYVRVKYSVYANASGTAQVAVADTPDYFNGFREGAFSAESGAGFSGQIEQPNKPTFKNKTVKVGLAITKTVEGKVDTSKIFKFEVTANQPKINEDTGAIEGTAPVAGVYDATIGGQEVQVEFDVSGKAIVTLYAGEKINIEGLPSGTTYTIEEKDLPQGYSQTSANGASGTINNTNQSAEFVNTYHAENTTTFSGVKTMEGRSFKDGDSIKFTLEATNPTDAPMPKDSEGNVRDEVTINPKSGTSANFSFGEIKYTNEDLNGATSKVFKYKVTETCSNDGVEVVTKTNTIEVTVTDDGAGKLTIAKKYSNGDQLNFANKFEAAKATLKATKKMKNDDWGKATSFTFTLAKAEGTPADTPKPSPATATATKDAPEARWAELSFDHEGVFTYTITEKDDGIAGVTYDTEPHTVTVRVTKDEETNKLTATVKYDGDDDELHIENSFERVTTHFEAAKSFNDWSKADSFELVLSPVIYDREKQLMAPMPVVDGNTLKSESKKVTANDYTAVFSNITYDTTGTFEYIIKEKNDKKDGVYYDESEHKVKVVVSKKGDVDPDCPANEKNKMVCKVTYDNVEADKLTITNTYTAAKASLEATKNFNAWDRFVKGNPDFHFTFTLTAKNSDILDANGNATLSPMPAGATGTTKVINVTKQDKDAKFGEITFEKAGTYNYTIKETNDGVEGISYDDTEHEVKVVVNKDPTTNKLTTEVSYDKRDALTIKNNFDSSSATLQATKNFKGTDAWKKAEEFTFKLAAVDGAPLPEKTEGKATADSKTVVFGEVEYKTAGTYKYTITEVNDHVDGVTYDETPHNVVVTVAPDANGKLKATPKYDGADDLYIENEFKDTTAEIKATKSFNDWGKASSFTFTLTAGTNNAGTGVVTPMPEGVEGTSMTGTAKNNSDPVNFGTIHYDKAGTYNYTIKETNDHVDGVAYDESEHTVTVKVEKNASTNALSASVKYDTTKSDLTITNTYTSIKKQLEVTKDYPSWGDYLDAKFAFNLAAVGTAPMPTTGTTVTATKAEATKKFGEIEFTEAGVYKYTITEQNGKLPGVTYDLTPHNVTVTVVADPDTNALSATVEYDGSEEGLTVKNTFADTTADFKATKSFENWDKLPDDKASFTFDLAAVTANAPMPEDDITAASATQTSPDAVWASIHYDKPGTYEYTITERDGDVDGVSYDTTAHKVVVTVSQDPTTNKLSTAVAYDDKPSLTVTNTYADTSAQFKVTKSFDDWGKASSFTFDLKVDPQRAAKDDEGNALATPMPDKTTATATNANKEALFNSITYEHAGTYYYIIKEQDSHIDGVTYDTADKHVVVTVNKATDATNALTATVKYDGKDTLTVTNTFKSSKANIQATKSFLDENNKSAWGKATSFEFNLTAGKSTTKDADGKDVEGTSPMPAGSKDGKKSVTVTEKSATAMFGEIEYDKAGTYRYNITESKGDADGVTYDTQSHPVTVTVKKDDKNQLTATVTYGNGGDKSLTITNNYKATSAKIYAEKDFADWGKADSFEFTLAAVTAGAPMPAAGKEKATATKDNKKVDFGDIRYEKAGEYEYTITETKGSADGVTYDTTPHTATVKVTKDEDTNELSAVVTYGDGTVAKITNTYAATEAEIKVQKDFADWGKATEFKFDLAAVTEGAPMPETKQVTAKDGKAVSFGKITYEKTGTYEYTITEQNGGVAGVSYDTAPKKVTVKVTKDDDNKMSAAVTYSNTEANADADAQVVTNTFEDVKVPVEVTKVYNGDADWGKADSFTFNLTAVTENAPMPKDANGKEVTQVVATKGHETQSFGNITFEKDGTYVYNITEVNDGKDGVSYDTTAHKVLIQVKKANDRTNKLTATVTYDDKDTELTVTNTYAAVKTHMEVTKDFSEWGHAKQFDFVLAPDPDRKSAASDGKAIDTPMPATQDYETHAIASKKTGIFDDITYEKAGTYYYTITEVKGNADGVTYDTAPKHVVVTVTKAKDATNALTATIDYEGKSSLTVTNKYASSDATIQVTKQIADWGTADHFDFVLTAGESSVQDADGNKLDSPMPAGAEDGKITATATKGHLTAEFGKVTYEQTGTYKYTINEVNGKADGVKYDTSTHDVLVKVTKDADNKMTATVTYDDGADALTIENEYKTVKTHFEVTKNFNDWNNSATTFTFDLAAVKATAADGTAITPVPMPAQVNASATTATDKKAVFGDIEYKQAGTYEYTITEKDGKSDGVKYDLTPHKVVVTVSKADDATNALTATVKYDDKDKLEVTNTYKSTKTEIKVEKDFADWGKATGFTFNLAAVTEGAPMPTTTSVTATEDAKVQSFGEIEFKKTGEYKYTITEENGGADGVSYDTTPKNVTVTVTKEADNQMTAAVTYEKGTDAQIVKNTYASVEAPIEVTKDFADWGKADSFTFKLAAVTKDAPMPKDKDGKDVTEATATQKAKLASFGNITFEKAATYEYTITEVNDGKDGVSYDTTAHKVVVTVKKADDATNALIASVKYDNAGSLIIKNTYAGTTAELKATKSFTEWGKADTFKFDLEAGDSSIQNADGTAVKSPMPADAKDGMLTKDVTEDAKTANFGTIKYEKAGTYKYTITEQNSHVDGVTYDTKAHEVVVTVAKADDATNKLTAEVKYDGKDALTITNTFASSKATLAVTKSFKDWGKADSFTFNLAAVDGAPLKDEKGEQIKTQVVATKGNETQTFGTISYDKAGTYEYTITEVNDGKDGVSYDTTPHTVTVTVAKDDTTNNLTATVKYDVTEESTGTDDLTVTNTYESTKTSIEATKIFSDWGKADSFTFDLEAVDGAPMPAGAKDGKISGTATEEDATVNFGDITYEKAGTYKYTVTEQKGDADGVTYDTTAHEVTVTVEKADDATNKLTATVDYGKAGKLEITNTYATTDAEIKVTKEFEDWGKADEFKFDLAAVTEGAPMPKNEAGAEVTQVTATKDAKTQSFGKITYEKTGEYQYTITEQNGGKDGVSYDTTPKTVTVKVTKDADNKMSVAVTYSNDEKHAAVKDAQVITNTYAATTAELKVEKDFADWGKADEFKFDLAAITKDAPMPAETTVTATEDAKVASFGEITFEKAGTYKYTITEQNGGADGVSYDTTAHNVTVEVNKANDATNALTATVTYDKGTDAQIITNTYASTTATLKATKSFTDWGKADEFKFDLEAVDGAPMPAGATDGKLTATATEKQTTATFGEITYEKAGTYKYTITEQNGKVDGVSYDTKAHNVVVTVSKAEDATNALSADVKYDVTDEKEGTTSLTIINTFKGQEASLQVTKELLEGGKDVWSEFPDYEFTFKLEPVDDAPMTDKDGKEIADTAKATATSRAAVFDAIQFEKVGVYEYTITEVKGTDAGVTYDTTAHKAVVTVTKADDATNALSATVSYDPAETAEDDSEAAQGSEVLTITNTVIRVCKVDAVTGEELTGATIEVVDKKTGKTIDSWTSETGVKHAVENVERGGEYILRETVAPNGYTVTNETTFAIDENGKITNATTTVREDGVLLVEDHLSELKVKKTDILTGDDLEGAHLQILDAEGKVVKDWTTGKQPVEFTGLKADGKYVLHEVSAPEGWDVAVDIPFTIAADGTITCETLNAQDPTMIVMTDARRLGVQNQTFAKTDVAGKALKGATLQITDAAGKQVAAWVTDGKVHEENLDEGDYTLSETKAPNGYAIANPIKFHVDAQRNVTFEKAYEYAGKGTANVTMVDQKVAAETETEKQTEAKKQKQSETQTETKAVKTGDETPILPIAVTLGISALVILVLLLAIFRKKREET